MHWLIPLGLIAAGIIALSALIISKLPQAKEMIDKLSTVQGFIGVALLALGLIGFIKILDEIGNINKAPVLFVLTIYGGLASAILLGFFLGMPLIAKWIPGESPAEQKALEMQKKILPYQTILGAAAIGTSVLWMYYNMKDVEGAIMKFLF